MIESPVWTPIGSRFSMEQTITALSLRSRITSSSNSFHPYTDSSTRISPTGDVARPLRATSMKCSSSSAMPVPPPPRMNEGRTITGNPISLAIFTASPIDRAYPALGTARPAASIVSLNRPRSSAFSMTSRSAPIISTPWRSSTPLRARLAATFRAVCPPMVGSNASGCSLAMISATTSGVIGSM